MKLKSILGMLLLTASAAAFAHTVQVEVDGLNCALCSEEMKTKLKSVSGADKVVPRLECGRIYLELPGATALNESGLRMTLLQSGFMMGNVSNVELPISRAETEKC